MRLLYTLTAYPPYIGGAQLHQHNLAQQLQQRHQVQVVSHWDQNRTDWLFGTTLNAPHQSRDYQVDHIPVHRVGLSWREKLALAPALPIYYPFMASALSLITPVLESHLAPFATQADLIHNVRIGREGLSYASLQAARYQDIPFVLTPVHHPRWVGWRYNAYLKLYQLADQVIALTQTEKQTLVHLGVSDQRISVIGNAPMLAQSANADRFRQTYGIQEPMILFLGQHYPYKGYRQLLQATPLVWQKLPEAQFVFIGPAVRQSDQEFQQVDRRIHQLGLVDLQTKTDAIAACSLLCVPSSQESFGGVYTEAWSFQKPVIGCRIPAVAEVITDEVDGFLVDQDAAQISDRICHLLLNPLIAKKMGKAGFQKVQSDYNWPAVATRLESAYQKVL